MKDRIHIAPVTTGRFARARHALLIAFGILGALAGDASLLDPTVQAQTRSSRSGLSAQVAPSLSGDRVRFLTSSFTTGTAGLFNEAEAPPRIKIGTWNTMLQPWFPYEADVIRTVAGTDFDVLALQEVWTVGAKDRIVSDPAVSAKYPYHYYAPARQDVGIVPNFVPQSFQKDYIECLVLGGHDTRTLEQPTAPIAIDCQGIGLVVALTSSFGFECLINTMQQLGAADDPQTVTHICEQVDGVRYAHGGRPGLLILSNTPLEDLQTVTYDTFLIRRAVIYATMRGTRFAFTQFPTNIFEDMDPSLAHFLSGPTQTQVAADVISADPDVIVGDFNSGPDYQPAGHDLLVQNGYRPLFSGVTFCPPSTHASFPPCQPPTATFGIGTGPRSIDNIYVRSNAPGYVTAHFADNPVSDHIGLWAAYATAPPVITLTPAVSSFPPNHNYLARTISQMVASATDDYDGNLLGSVIIERVTSDEPDNAPGNSDGNTVSDIVIAPDCTSLQVRSERDETKNGRVYVVTLRLQDSSGNTVRAEYTISVPLNQSGVPAVQGAAAFTVASNCS